MKINFDLDIYDPNLESFWYTIDNSPIKNYDTVTNGVNLISISEPIWDSLPDGNHIFRFFANDTLGHGTIVEISISKYTSVDTEPGIPGFSLVIVIGTILASIGFSAYKIKKKKNFNYFYLFLFFLTTIIIVTKKVPNKTIDILYPGISG